MPEDMPEHMPEDMSGRMPEDMPDRMPDRMPEDMSDRMPEDLPVRKCINVMVGITRSKVFFLFIESNSLHKLSNASLLTFRSQHGSLWLRQSFVLHLLASAHGEEQPLIRSFRLDHLDHFDLDEKSMSAFHVELSSCFNRFRRDTSSRGQMESKSVGHRA